jgi:hypothetical protein
MLFAVPATWSTVFNITIMFYILPSAQCDLILSHLDKGILNTVVYAGKTVLISHFYFILPSLCVWFVEIVFSANYRMDQLSMSFSMSVDNLMFPKHESMWCVRF